MRYFYSFKGLNKCLGLLLLIVSCSWLSVSQADVTSRCNRKLIKILSVDGGGIRGIIPAMILKSLEDKLKKKHHLSECFDVMAGSSTGGILVLLLNTPDDEGRPKFYAQEVVDFYRSLGPVVFNRSMWHSLVSLNGWIGEKYSEKVLEEKLWEYFGETRLSDALSEVIIPAYDINYYTVNFFKSSKAKSELSRDFYFKDVARASSAAPTYFKPAEISDVYQQTTQTLIDGGVAVNNPAMSAVVHAIKLFGRGHDFLVVSVGTGTDYEVEDDVNVGEKRLESTSLKSWSKVGWAEQIIPVMMDGNSDVVHYQMSEVLARDLDVKKYYRIQAIIPAEYAELDNVEPENIKQLESYAEELVKKHDKEISYIATLIDN